MLVASVSQHKSIFNSNQFLLLSFHKLELISDPSVLWTYITRDTSATAAVKTYKHMSVGKKVKFNHRLVVGSKIH